MDASSRRGRRFATLPRVSAHSLEWHNGLLYVAGGFRLSDDRSLNSFSAFNEATGRWEDLQPMLYACRGAASGVIGNELFIAGGYAEDNEGVRSTLQIYDIAGGSWRLGAALPEPRTGAIGVVADGKLFVIARLWSRDLLVYDPRSDTWAEEAPLSTVTNYNVAMVRSACAHKNRLVVFLSSGRAFERADDGSWCAYEVAEGASHLLFSVAESVILG